MLSVGEGVGVGVFAWWCVCVMVFALSSLSARCYRRPPFTRLRRTTLSVARLAAQTGAAADDRHRQPPPTTANHHADLAAGWHQRRSMFRKPCSESRVSLASRTNKSCVRPRGSVGCVCTCALCWNVGIERACVRPQMGVVVVPWR